MMNDQKFVHDPAYRRGRLSELRDRIQKGKINDALRKQVLRLAHAQYPGKGLFARSSANAEDLPNFSGAGLHSSVPNVKAITNYWKRSRPSGRHSGTLKPTKRGNAPASIMRRFTWPC